MKYLLSYLKKYKKESILAPLFKCLEACFDLVVPLIVADIIDNGITSGDKGYILSRFGLLVLMAVLGLASSVTAQFFAAKAAVGTSAMLRHDLFSKIQTLGYSELDKVGTSTLITRMTGDVNQIQSGVNMFLRLFMRSPFIVFGAMILAFTIDFELAMLFVAAILVLFVIVFGFMKITNPMYKKVQENLDGVTEETRENLNGVRVIRAFCREENQKEKFRKHNSMLLASQIKVGNVSAFMNPLTYLVVNTVVILVLWLGASKVDSGVLMSGAIIALINYIGQILVELVKLANLIVLLGKSAASLSRVAKVFETESSLVYGSGIAENDFCESQTDEVVRFENVSMQYDGAGDKSLSDISFTVKKGETVGIIGGTGSGKSTLINLIPRFYDATEGSVYLNGFDVKTLDKETLNNAVAVVPQKSLLFAGTIKSNLLWGNKNATEDDIKKALELSQAAEFVAKKEKGIDEVVEQGGANLSGGQKQRLSIARALLKNSKILIFDDSSSALDFATDAALRKGLRTLTDDTTVFIVSQRTGSVAHADKIIVLDDGKAVGIGRHEELLESCMVYREIYESQFRKEDM